MAANIIVDLVIVAIVLSGAFIGIKRGFILTLAKPIKLIASIVIALSLCNTVATSIVQPMIEAPITNQISSYLTEECEEITAENAKDELPTLLKLAAGIVGVDVESVMGDGTSEYISEIVDKLAVPAIHLIAVVISYFALYFLSKILISLAVSLINGIFSGGIFGIANKILGFLVSTFFAFVAAWLLTSLFGYIINIPAFKEVGWINSFEGGYVYKFFKEISPIDLLLSF
jgi:uncharacterized membrane protein required for colicin V production